MAFALAGILAGCGADGPPPDAEGDIAETTGELRIPRLCGGRAGNPCASDELCVPFLSMGCPGPDRLGLCLPKPRHCPTMNRPVCGCDGTTYDNLCEAAQAGVVMEHRGSCEPPPPPPPPPPPAGTCGGADGMTCPGAGVCVDDPTDSCVPGSGGDDDDDDDDDCDGDHHWGFRFGHHADRDDDDDDAPSQCANRCECNDVLPCGRFERWNADPAVCACESDPDLDPCARVTCPDGTQCVAAPDGSTSCQ